MVTFSVGRKNTNKGLDIVFFFATFYLMIKVKGRPSSSRYSPYGQMRDIGAAGEKCMHKENDIIIEQNNKILAILKKQKEEEWN